jgi:TetR/AcrR family transcriptional regulator, repressor for neighboring sulfatase
VPRPKRIRRGVDESRRLILAAAEELLVERGPAAVTVTAVAGRVGLTDAAVNYHFGTRDGLLEALLRHGGRRLRDGLAEAIAGVGAEPDLGRIVDAVAGAYADGGYARLALGLHLAGWRDPASGLLNPLVDALHAARCRHADAAGRRRPAKEDTRIAVAALHQALATEPLFGPEFRRSAGIGERRATNAGLQRRWWARTLSLALFGAADDPGTG